MGSVSVGPPSVSAVRVEILHTDRGVRLLTRVPETRRERARGLIGARALAPGTAMLFERSRSVHTIGMRFEIAVAFLDADLRVVSVVPLPPGRVLLPRRRSRHVLEMPTDTALTPGDVLRRGV